MSNTPAASPAPSSSATERLCPQCGASCALDVARCWLCHAELAPATDAEASPSPTQATTQFSIATILLVTTLIAVCLGVFRISPGLGLAIVAFAAPALIRTFVVGVQQKRVGQSLSIGEKLTAFVASLGIMILVGIAGVVAFQIACWGTCGLISAANSRSIISDAGFMASVVVGSLAALAIGVWILWATRPRRR
jgi:hypothetical protein